MPIIPSSTEESETERDGILSTLDEYHALIIGLTVGLVVAVAGAWELGTLFIAAVLGTKLSKVPLTVVRKERWYALGGFLLSVLIVWGARYLPTIVEVLR